MKKNLLVALFALLSLFVRLSAQTIITDTTAGAGSWVCPAGVTSVSVECWGAGGGGGFAHYEYSAAGSGAGGSYISYTMTVTPGKTYYFNVGAGGKGGTDSITPGGTGGASYFGSTTDTLQGSAVVLAVGGVGGNSTTVGGATAAHDSATGGVAVSSGNLPLSGFTTSLYGAASGSSTTTGATAGGAGANGGAGGAASTNYSASHIGYNGLTPGGGGSGAIDKTVKTGEVGGNGAVGELQLTYFSATSVQKPASFTATAVSPTEIDLAATSNANGNNIVVVYGTSNTFTATTDGVAAGAAGSSFAGGTIAYNGAASGLTKQTGLQPGTLYYFEAFAYDGSNDYSPAFVASATTLVSNIINTDFTGTTPNYFSGISTQAATVTQSWGVGVLSEHFAADTGFAIGTNSDSTAAGLYPIDTSLVFGASYSMAYAISNGWYVDYLIAPASGYSLDITGISGVMKQSASATANNFGVLYGVGSATNPPATFYNAISATKSADSTGTSMAATTENFSSATAGVTLNGVGNIADTNVLYVRVVVYRANKGVTKATLYNAGLTIGGTFSNDLPLRLTSFSASVNGKTIQTEWNTASELNTSHFNVQRSTNGSSFSNVGLVKAIGSGSNSYRFTDLSPIDGINYYRLQSIDKDGSSSYSKVVSVQLSENGNRLTVFPNPGKDKVTISFDRSIEDATIAVYDFTGKAVINQRLNGGSSSYLLNTQKLSSGVYVIKVKTDAGSSFNERLLIVK